MNKSKEYTVKINIKKESEDIRELRDRIKLEVIGQERAVRRLLRATASYFAGLKDPRRPIGGYLFAGPTGVGKTFTCKVFARHFLGGKDKYRDYLTRIDCSVLNKDHEISRLTGAPPGYVGYKEPPLLLQENIDIYHFDTKFGLGDGRLASEFKQIQNHKIAYSELLKYDPTGNSKRQIDPNNREELYEAGKPYRSVVLFDEIEKAHPRIPNALLQIMEEGELQLGSGAKTSFAHSVIALTTNIGQKKIQQMLKHWPYGTPEEQERLDDKIYEVVKKEIQEVFPPELFKRLDLIVFRPLKENDFVKILDNFLLEEQERLNQRIKLISRFSVDLEYTPEAKSFLLKEGVDIRYGVRTLRATVEKYVRVPIANGIASGEIRPGDKILIDEKKEKLVFYRKSRKRGQNAIIYKEKRKSSPFKFLKIGYNKSNGTPYRTFDSTRVFEKPADN